MILVPSNMPDCCSNCFCFDFDYYECVLTSEEIDPLRDDRPEKCPLIEVEDYKEEKDV